MSKKSVEQQAQEELREVERQFPGDTREGSSLTMNERGSVAAPKTERLLIPLDPNGTSDSVYLCVNGRNMVVRRGEMVELPAAFVEAYRNAQAQQAAALRAQQAALSKD